MATDLETAQARLALYIQAEASILGGQQEGTVQGRKFRFADLDVIRAEIRTLQAQIANLQDQASGSSRLYTGVPR